MVEQKIRDLLAAKFNDPAFADCFLIELKLHQNNKLEVFIDSDSNVTFEKCRALSRFLEKHIDESGWMGEKYTLEVSSPGLDRPLKLLRQYYKNIGRKVEVHLNDGEKKTGMLAEVGDRSIAIEEKVRIKAGKRKKTESQQVIIPFESIEKTFVKIIFQKYKS